MSREGGVTGVRFSVTGIESRGIGSPVQYLEPKLPRTVVFLVEVPAAAGISG